MIARDPESIRLVHLAPEPILSRYGAGNWKDLKARTISLSCLGLEVEPIGFSVERPGEVLNKISHDTTDVILEYSGRPDLMRRIVEHCPSVKIHLRLHNAEALQHWHRAQIGLFPNYKNVRNVYGVTRLGWMDRQSANLASSRLGISPWDNQHYWRKICGRPVDFLPYFSPWPSLRPDTVAPAYDQRPDRIICMPGGGDRLSRQQAELFHRIAADVQNCDRQSEREFWISGGVIGNRSNASPHVLQKPFDEPWDVLVHSRAVAILTDLGFGMKTTILDGLAAGSHVFVHAGLLKRLPPDVAAVVTPIDPSEPNLATSIVDRLKTAPRGGKSVHAAMRTCAIKTLADVLGVSHHQS